MVLRHPVTRFYIALLSSFTLAATCFAQTPAPSNVAAKPGATPVRSAFEGYRAYNDEALSNWKAANENVARIGGWREYARQAQGEAGTAGTPPRPAAQEAKPSVQPSAKPSAQPSTKPSEKAAP